MWPVDAGHVLLLDGNEMMRRTGLWRIQHCVDDAQIPDYAVDDVPLKLKGMVEGEQATSVRKALYECIAEFASSPLRRPLLRDAGVVDALRQAEKSESDAQLHAACLASIHAIERQPQ